MIWSTLNWDFFSHDNKVFFIKEALFDIFGGKQHIPTAHFKAQYQGETVSNFKNHDPIADITAANKWMKKCEKQKAPF